MRRVSSKKTNGQMWITPRPDRLRQAEEVAGVLRLVRLLQNPRSYRRVCQRLAPSATALIQEATDGRRAWSSAVILSAAALARVASAHAARRRTASGASTRRTIAPRSTRRSIRSTRTTSRACAWRGGGRRSIRHCSRPTPSSVCRTATRRRRSWSTACCTSPDGLGLVEAHRSGNRPDAVDAEAADARAGRAAGRRRPLGRRLLGRRAPRRGFSPRARSTCSRSTPRPASRSPTSATAARSISTSDSVR